MEEALRKHMVTSIIERMKDINDVTDQLRAGGADAERVRALLADVDRMSAELRGYIAAFNDAAGMRWVYDAGENVVRNKYQVALTIHDAAA